MPSNPPAPPQDKRPYKRLLRYTTTYKVDGVVKTLTYARAMHKRHRAAEDTYNQQYADALAEYTAACALGIAKDVRTETEEIVVG